MHSLDGRRDRAKLRSLSPGGRSVLDAAAMPSTAATLARAMAGSTLHRLRRGECALLAINLSLIAVQFSSLAHGAAEALVSLLVMGLMYAFNDAYDARADRNNPRKDPLLVATYLAHERTLTIAIFALKAATLALAFFALGARATAVAAGVMIVNVVYSTRLKGVPLLDVLWCTLWGALYAGIVCTSLPLLFLVGVMTGVCHLFQTLDDRTSDAANGIVTTAVRSPALATAVLVGLSILLLFALRGPLGMPWLLTAFTPLVLYFTVRRSGTGWILTKVYFGVVWLAVLGIDRAAG